MKRLLLGVLVIAMLLAVATILFVRRYDAHVVAHEITQQIERSTGLRVSSTEVVLHPIRGLSLADVSIEGRIDAGDLEARIDSVSLRHRWLPLLLGRLEIGSITISHPIVSLVSRQVSPSSISPSTRIEKRSARKKERQAKTDSTTVDEAMSATSPSSSRIRLSIARVLVEGGEISARTAESPEVDFLIEDLKMRLRDLRFDPAAKSWSRALSGRGLVSTGRLVHGDFSAEDTRGRISLQEGVATISQLEIQSQHAHIESEPIVLLLGENPPAYSLRADGELDLNGVIGAASPDGFGPLHFVLDAAGIGPEWITLTGQGSALMEGGTIPAIPSVAAVESTVGRQLLTGRRYEETSLVFEFRDRRVWIDPFVLRGEGGRLDVGGSVGLGPDGDVALAVTVHVEPESLGVEGALADLLGQLAGDAGELTVPLSVTGTIEHPRVSLGDADAMDEDQPREHRRKAFDRRIEEVKDKVEAWLEGQTEVDSPD